MDVWQMRRNEEGKAPERFAGTILAARARDSHSLTASFDRTMQ